MIETETRIFSIEKEQITKLNDLFWQIENSKNIQSVAIAGATLATSGAIISTGSVMAVSDAATTIAGGVADAVAMIQAIDGLSLAAFGVALAPMGFMVTLRVLNMVLSRV